MDESGILSGDTQRFFCLGFMKIQDSGPFNDTAHRIHDRAVSGLALAEAAFEFKFNSVTARSLRFYLELVDAYFAQPDYYFCAFVMDKARPNVNWQRFFGSVWEAYISYSKMVVRNNIASDEEVCLIADYFGKPKESQKYFEAEMRNCHGSRGLFPGRVFNACMLDSCSSLMIQTVDVILGGVRYAFLLDREPGIPYDAEKRAISERIREHVGRPALSRSFTRPEPQYFSVWEFQP